MSNEYESLRHAERPRNLESNADTRDEFAGASSLANAPSADWFSGAFDGVGTFATVAQEAEAVAKTIGEKLNALLADRDALIRVHCPE